MNPIVRSRDRLNFRSLLTALCLTLTLVSFTGLSPAQAGEQRLRTLTVTGRGIEAIPTTQTQVRLGVEAQGKTAAKVQQEVARRSSAVVELLRSRQVEKLETAGITLNPIYNYESKPSPQITGYTATNTVTFRINTQSGGTLLDDAVNAGATRIDGVSFVAAESAIESARKQALKTATQDAQSQADAVLSALNLKRGEILSIQVNGASAPPPVYRQAAARATFADATTPVVGGEQQIEASVTLQISY
ncbi:SIMPL domain-containing protein [Tychonema sp. BBK16]|uniref:SIMPL domain-containing protein n=1 Tax=Tychonema sp. BBK16 TaxID=2699888 RepID=UPI001F47B5BD|nr:SIMPL domain-containing protein [Tychonema sp. BBK16]MCF6374451.1 SIMPL domain-containing protein [Tychonema sp. BBK16]